MTWNPLKNKIEIPKPLPASPCLTDAESRELDIMIQKVIHTEKTIRHAIKEMNKYLITVKNLDTADQRLTTNLTTCELVHISDEFRQIIENYHSVTTQFGATVQNTALYFGKTFVEPLKKLHQELAFIRDALLKRNDLATSWSLAHANVRKYQERREKTATLSVKLQREKTAEQTLSKELKQCHGNLLAELPVFLEKRLEYLKPVVSAMVAIQLDYYGDSMRAYTQLMTQGGSKSNSPTSGKRAEEEYRERMNRGFERIKNLTIVRND